MKSRTMCISAVTLFAALALPLSMAAQQTRYKFIDIPTLGGPAAIGQVDGTGISQFINNPGVVVGGAGTSIPDPNASGCADCFLVHAFQWQNDVLTDLGALPGVNFSHAISTNARGWATGGSFTAGIDPLTEGPTEHAVLWKDGEIIDLGTLLTGVDSAGLYVNNGGEVVGFSTVDTTTDPFALGPFPSPTHAFIRQNGVMRDLGTLGGTDQIPASERQEDGILIRHKRVRCPGACSLAQWYYMPKLGVPRE